MSLQGCNGISFLWLPSKLTCQHFTSDASGSWGCGAWHGDKWFQLQWRADSAHSREGDDPHYPSLCSLGVTIRSPASMINQVVIACLKSRMRKAKGLMHLLRSLVFIEAHFHCYLKPTYIDTHKNYSEDDLTHDNLSSFLSKVPTAKHDPTPISDALYWHSCWTPKQTGYLRHGTSSSTIFSVRPSTIHTENLSSIIIL